MDSPADVLRKAREAKGYTGPYEAARAFGWNEVTYASHENGSRGIRPDVAKRYAKAFGISAADLLQIQNGPQKQMLVGDPIKIKIEVAVGVWKDSRIDNPRAETKSISLPSKTVGRGMRFAVEIADESVNRVFDPGDFAIIEPVEPSEAMHCNVDNLVYVERKRGDLVERSIRRVSSNDGFTLKLVNHSTDPKFKETLTVPSTDRGETIKIEGRIVGKYSEFDL